MKRGRQRYISSTTTSPSLLLIHSTSLNSSTPHFTHKQLIHQPTPQPTKLIFNHHPITMKSFASALPLLALLSSALAAPVDAAADATSVSVSYDTAYDVSTTSLDTVSCSDGTYGLVSKWPTFGSIPSFPYIGGSPTIAGWDDPNCGKCYELDYAGNVIYITAIDAAPGGFNIGLTAMNALTGGEAEDLGRVTATYTLVDSSLCASAI
ncbi:Cerato-platanin-domain-containing protein [Aspergillus heteromorphus CBS 117.55]|uniref:Cerato-platanin-domain-containing protein n=1 Tax=Aspergillus heteromorphus CBS 117.55 TaxID=1448321 RepID=A0A317VJ41_9EURO|nr:Cerato-platanin-domain-containing protein [Aspergillus heteromorphus CBS 117.55]PWY74384.1 Cerato-platanin-domain-containing protein [Aspergillus heteromorphus CBS 117.55]